MRVNLHYGFGRRYDSRHKSKIRFSSTHRNRLSQTVPVCNRWLAPEGTCKRLSAGGNGLGLLGFNVSFNAVKSAFNTPCETLGAKLVLLCLAYHRNRNTGQCNPSLATIAKECGMSRRGVQKALRGLEAINRVKTSPETFNSNHYRLFLGGERSSLPPRTGFAPSANLVTETGEPSSPKPQGTTNEPCDIDKNGKPQWPTKDDFEKLRKSLSCLERK